jgi:hypothetical protein
MKRFKPTDFNSQIFVNTIPQKCERVIEEYSLRYCCARLVLNGEGV